MASMKLLDFWAPWCIDPQTPVLTENGYIKASQVQIGHRLITIDPKTKKHSIRTVQRIRTFKDVPSKKIVLETGRKLIGDINHQVLTQEGFKRLDELVMGEKVLINPVNDIEIFQSERNKIILKTSVKQAVLSQLALSVDNQIITQNFQIPIDKAYSWKYDKKDRQPDQLLWEKIADIVDVENRDVIGITIEEPHTLVTNGIVSHNCGPCRVMAPVLEELKKELGDKAQIEEINVDEKPQEAQKYGVMSIPTYIVLKDDKEVGRKIGVTSKAELLKLLQS